MSGQILTGSRIFGILWPMENSNSFENRIRQWENMTQLDPTEAMGWFSLGNAYRDAGREEEAARALRKCLELDAGFSRAYQLLGQLLIKSGAEEQAAEILTTGYRKAAERGDVMPQQAMGSLLEKIGKPVPEVAKAAPAEEDMGDELVHDRRTGRTGPRLPDPPLKGALGEFIQAHYSALTWRQWIGQGTKVINELRLDFSNIEHRSTYDIHMMEWLGFTREEVEAFEKEQGGVKKG